MDLFNDRPTYEELLTRLEALEAAVFAKPVRERCTEVPPEIEEAWLRWSNFRRGKGWTAAAKTINAKKLMELSAGKTAVALQIVEQSIERGWTGLFPLKVDIGTTSAQPVAKMKTVAEVLAPKESPYERKMGWLRQQLSYGAITQEDFDRQAREARK